MKLSVAYTFEPGLINKLIEYKDIYEVYGKPVNDFIGGGRSGYTLRNASFRHLRKVVDICHNNGIEFNYLLNGANLGGVEQTKAGHKKIRKLLDKLTEFKIDSITAASPMLTKLIKKQYPHFKIRVSAFAMIDSPLKAKQWEDIGADALCLSAISCNRDFNTLRKIRKSVNAELQLIANASCILKCAYEPTHMNLLADSSRKSHPLKGMCLDYCILNCAQKRLKDKSNYIRATWIRPEDTVFYEDIGIDSFKIVERSLPADLLLKRVNAYSRKSFDDNLYEITGPVAQIKKEQNTSLFQRLKMIKTMLKPGKIKISSLLRMKHFAEELIPHDFSRENSHIYIDNKKLDGFLENYINNGCNNDNCEDCSLCRNWAEKAVTIKTEKNNELLVMAESLDESIHDSSLWL